MLVIPTATLPRTTSVALSAVNDGDGTTYGRRQFWEQSYAEDAGSSFSWYSGWDDLEPFWRELVPDTTSRVLIPGVGNDDAMVKMYDAGWRMLTAIDYAPAGVARASSLFGERTAVVEVADVRELPYGAAAFDAVLDKGTLDAVYLSGGSRAKDRDRELQRAVDDLHRVLRPGGVCMSITAAAAIHLPGAFAKGGSWRILRDGGLHITEDGFASINIAATMFAWERQ